jgi:acetylornithine deacetylase/succinyl-diaminopimelate desuccinylase-like protein
MTSSRPSRWSCGESPAFEPVERERNLHARAFRHERPGHGGLKAIEAIVNTGKLPVNIKMIVEGEEEIGLRTGTLSLKQGAAGRRFCPLTWTAA